MRVPVGRRYPHFVVHRRRRCGRAHYAADADFDEGVLVGLEHETVPDQLQFTTEPKMMPFIWIPNDGQGTISKVKTDTGDEVGRYRVSPHRDSMPSRPGPRGTCPHSSLAAFRSAEVSDET